MARGVEGRAIYADDEDRRFFLRVLRSSAHRYRVQLLAHCLMGNHFHLAVRVSDIPLSRMMHRLLTTYGIKFNERHGRVGHLFQSRYKAALCTDDRYLVTLVRYIHENPVRANLVARASDWQWSNAPKGSEVDAGEILDGFEPWPVAADLRLIRADEAVELESLDSLAQRIGIPPATLQSRSRCRLVTEPKARFAEKAVKAGHPVAAVARWLRMSEAAIRHHLRKFRRF